MNSLKVAFLIVVGLSPAWALAGGSIVINSAAPSSELVYNDDSGSSRRLKVSWSDIQVMDAARRFLVERFGRSGRDQPFYINRQTQMVSYYSPVEERYQEISIRELLRRN